MYSMSVWINLTYLGKRYSHVCLDKTHPTAAHTPPDTQPWEDSSSVAVWRRWPCQSIWSLAICVCLCWEHNHYHYSAQSLSRKSLNSFLVNMGYHPCLVESGSWLSLSRINSQFSAYLFCNIWPHQNCYLLGQ